jgi:hypothetical protein
MINGGVDNMYVFDGESDLTLVEEKPGWFSDMVNVMDGDFSVENDKFMLVDVILGLYGFALMCDRQTPVQQSEDVVRKVSSDGSVDLAREHRDIAFPSRYFNGLNDRLEREVDKAFMKDSNSLWSEDELSKLLAASQAFTRIHQPKAPEVPSLLDAMLTNKPPAKINIVAPPQSDMPGAIPDSGDGSSPLAPTATAHDISYQLGTSTDVNWMAASDNLG